MFSGISPEDIFADYGITGYVQASSCQKIWQSYYYAEETFQTQNPKVVVLDTFMVMDGASQSEAFNREAIDRMRLSPAKIHSVKTAVKNNPDSEDFMSYLFLLLRYHDRWEDLKAEDYLWFINESDSPAKGFLARIGSVPAVFPEESYADSSVEPKVIDKKCLTYLNKLKELCEKNGSHLVLTKIPTCLWEGASSASVRQWAEKNNVPFLDYNADEKLREEEDIDWKSDSLDGGNHLNYSGVMKMSKVFGKYLTKEFLFEDKRENESYQMWKRDYGYYKKCVKNYELANTTGLAEYLNRIKDGDYIVIISCKNVNAAADLEGMKFLTEFGIVEELLDQALAKNNLLIIEDGQIIYSKIGKQDIRFENELAGLNVITSSKMQGEESVFECVVNRKNVTKGKDGVQIVILDSLTHSVADSCSVVLNGEQRLGLER